MKITTTRGGRIRSVATAGAVAAALVLVGCSGGTEAPAEAPEETTATEGGSDLEAQLAEFMALQDEYDMPTEAVTDGTVLQGKTIHYIPITNYAPQFALTAAVLQEAVAAVGASLTVCDGGGNPTTIGSCVDTARNDATVGAIITDGFYYGMAANALNAAQEAGVKVVYSNQFAEDAFPESETQANVNAPGTEMVNELATWVAVDSEGTGNLLFIRSADGPGTQKFADEGLAQLATDCPDCTVATIDITTATQNQLEGELNTKLLQDPNIQYVTPQFAQYLPIVIPTTRASGSQAKIGTTAATLGALQAVANGDVQAASGQSAPFGAWALIDTALRLNNGQDIHPYVLPTRLFTADNIGDVDVSEAAEASGEWYGPVSFKDDFKSLWSVS